jgi:ribosome-associated protein
MNVEQLRDLALKTLEEMKGINIVTMDVHTLTSITDYMIICTATSTRHLKTLADYVAMKAKEKGAKYAQIEGEKETEWILVDLGDVVVHIMLGSVRSLYRLEDLWEPIKELREQKNN